MKRVLTCHHCAMKESHYAELQEHDNEGVFEFFCSNGHQNIIRLQQQKFELLFDYAVLALIDGYPREVITSCAASLERFYEFYIRVIACKNNVSQDDFNLSWKLVDNQSERQLGAYMMIYLLENQGKKVPTIDDVKPEIEGISKSKTRTWKSFRNNVVHKGYMPSMKESTAYLKIVYEHIVELINHLVETYPDDLLKASRQVSPKVFELAEEKNTEITTLGLPGVIILNPYNKSECDFEKALERFKSFTIPHGFAQ